MPRLVNRSDVWLAKRNINILTTLGSKAGIIILLSALS